MIRLGERVFAVGTTGEGKSEVLLHLFAKHTGQRVLIDVADHYELGPGPRAEEPPALEVSRPGDLDARHRTIRYVPRRPGDLREMDELYRVLFSWGRVLVVADELEDIAPVGRTPTWVRKAIKQGRKERLTHLGATQRPSGVEPAAINQATHAAVFKMVDARDLAVLSYRLGLSTRELAAALNSLPTHGYLWHTLGDPTIRRMPPLPAPMIAETRRHVLNPS